MVNSYFSRCPSKMLISRTYSKINKPHNFPSLHLGKENVPFSFVNGNKRTLKRLTLHENKTKRVKKESHLTPKDKALDVMYQQKNAIFSAADEFQLVEASPDELQKPKKVHVKEKKTRRTKEPSFIPIDLNADPLPHVDAFFETQLSLLPSSNFELENHNPISFSDFQSPKASENPKVFDGTENDSQKENCDKNGFQDFYENGKIDNYDYHDYDNNEDNFEESINQKSPKNSEIPGDCLVSCEYTTYPKELCEVYSEYLMDEKKAGSTEVWSIDEFREYVWVLAGFN